MFTWKSKVLPKIRQFLDKGNKKAVGVFIKKFDTQKEAFGSDIQDKKDEFQPKVVEIYRSSTPETQTVLKNPTEDSLKEKPDAVHALLVELGKAGIPGAELLSEATGKFGANNLPQPVLFMLGEVSSFVVDEPAPVLPPAPPAEEATGGAVEKVEVVSKEIEVGATTPPDTSAEELSSVSSKPVEAPPATTPSPPAPATEPETSAPPTKATPADAAAPVAPAPAAPASTTIPNVIASAPAPTRAAVAAASPS